MNDKRLLLFILIPIAIMVGFFLFKLMTVATGTEIILDTKPVDPKDSFRGDYLELQYEISTIDLEKLESTEEFSQGDTIYATLSKKEEFWDIDSISKTKPELKEEQVCMKGTIKRVRNKKLSVEWGIENYFAPLGQGESIDGNISVVVAVDPSCSSIVRRILSNGKPVEFEK